jgi:hypothetical protein
MRLTGFRGSRRAKTPRASPYNGSARYGLVALLMSRRHVLLDDLLALIVEHGVAPSEIGRRIHHNGTRNSNALPPARLKINGLFVQ